MSVKVQRLSVLLLFVLIAFGVGRWSSSCDEKKEALREKQITPVKEKRRSTVEKIKQKGRLDVVMVNGPTTYFVGATGAEGFEYLLMERFAEYLDVKLKLHVVSTVNEALSLSKEGVGEITSGALTKTKERAQEFMFGPSYFRVKEQVVCDQSMIRKKEFPRSVADLVGLKITVGENTSYAQTLKALQKEMPQLHFNLNREASSETLLEWVAKKKIDCTVVDSNIFAINNRYYPTLRKAFTLGKHKQLAWILRPGEEDLNVTLNGWLSKMERSGDMVRLQDHYYSYVDRFNYVNITTFHKRLKTRLPKYKKEFMGAGKKYDIPWTLLAAQSYQESHWDRLAKSPTGVRGLMMLTQVTAKEMGVQYRTNAKQSIYGGTKYYASIYKRIPKDVTGLDRYKFAFAAYNVGMGHLYDARSLAKKQGKDENSWKDLKSVLPLLSKRKYYKDLKYGYARGQEPVKYVDAIYEYHSILEKEYKKKGK